MNFHPTENASLWPLLQETSIGEQLIASSKLVDLQIENAGDISDAHQLENSWITQADWQLLAKSPAPSVLKSTLGITLAWTGDISEASPSITASDQSFLIRFPWEFIQINEQLVSAITENNFIGDVSPAAHIDGFVEVGEGSRILPGVVIEGNIIIGKNCKIGPNCYLRGSTTIGDGCHIGQSVEVKNSIIGHGSSVGHLSYVGDSVIGNNANLGAGTITSNLRHDGSNHRSMVDGELTDTGRRKFGCIVGDGVHTGILTAIYPGRKLGPNSSTLPNGTVDADII